MERHSKKTIYRNNLKNREFGEEAPQNFCSEQASLAARQGASENKKFETKPTTPETDSSGCFGINNSFYDQLGEDWYHGFDHPIALLRAENALRIPWIAKNLAPSSSVLDIGCGAGFLTNALALEGHRVSGIDLSQKSLEIAEKYDETRTVCYKTANAYSLPFSDNEFDAVCAMDVLEHVENPRLLIQEASRVLKPRGLFFFHTFNRSLLSYLLVIKGVDWCVPNAPKNMHVYPLFIKPKELEAMCESHRLNIQTLLGFQPRFSKPLWKMVLQRRVPPDFSFKFSRSLRTGYCGYARKRGTISVF